MSTGDSYSPRTPGSFPYGTCIYSMFCYQLLLNLSCFLDFDFDHYSVLIFLLIARLCHIGHGFLRFSHMLLNSERKICNKAM